MQDSTTWVFRKNSPLIDLFSYELNQLKETGVIGKIIGNYIDEDTPVFCETSSFKPIEYENIFTAFVLLVVGAILAIMAVVFERIRRPGHKYVVPFPTTKHKMQ